jgi:hypothetical protein
LKGDPQVFRFFLILAIVVSSCDDSKNKGSEDNSGANNRGISSEEPEAGADIDSQRHSDDIIAKYFPETKYEWRSEPYFPNLPKAEGLVADDYFSWFESIYDNWGRSIVTGFAPRTYLDYFPAAPEKIEFVDETKGTVLGMEKLQGVFPEMLKRCPSLSDDRLKAPLRVRWQDRFQPGTTGNFLARHVQLGTRDDGSVWPTAPLLWFPEIEIRGEYVKPANTPEGWRGYQYPKQTFLEQTGGKTWAEGASAPLSLDQTFAHELGHFLVQAWALNAGRSPIQSFMFSEFFADTVRILCWGSYYDDPAWVAGEIERGRSVTDPRPFGNDEAIWRTVSRRYAGVNYGLYSFASLIAWEKSNNRFDADVMLRAMVDTLDSMTGVIIKDYPAFDANDKSLLTDLLPWSRTISSREVIDRAPMMLTRQEFLEKFCGFYPCGELTFLIKADAEGNRNSEW